MIYDVWVTEIYNVLVRVEAEDEFDAQDRADAFVAELDPMKDMRFGERTAEVDAGYEPGMEQDNHVDVDLTKKEAEDGDSGTKAL